MSRKWIALLVAMLACFAGGECCAGKGTVGKAKDVKKASNDVAKAKKERPTLHPHFSYHGWVPQRQTSDGKKFTGVTPGRFAFPTETEDDLRRAHLHKHIGDFLDGKTNSLGGYDAILHKIK